MLICPECGEPLEEEMMYGRHSGRWTCRNPRCPVMFIEKRVEIVRDPLMAR
jgi:hypothetical protein